VTPRDEAQRLHIYAKEELVVLPRLRESQVGGKCSYDGPGFGV